ncbi:MAG: hypothetical protein ACE5D0_10395 [Fidelibacterota bacterium]
MNYEGQSEEKIKAALMFGHFDQLDGILIEAIKSGVKPSILRNTYEKLGDHHTQYKRWFESLKAYEAGRKCVPFHPRHVNKELKVLKEFWSKAKKELTANDMIALGRFIEDILEDYQRPEIRNFYGPTIEIGEVMLGEIVERMRGASTKAKSPYSAGLSQLIISKYAYLTEEERAKEFGRIMGKALRKIAINRNDQTAKIITEEGTDMSVVENK